jgi:inward rectifier potassium channel
MRVLGLRRHPLSDVYHRLVTGSWTSLCLTFGLVYFVTEAAFEAAHYGLAGARAVAPGAVFATIRALLRGEYAAEMLDMKALAAAFVGAVAGFVRWAELVIGAGVVLAKFARVRARILFSDMVAIAPQRDGQALLFRMANERAGHVVDARVYLLLVRNERDEAGEVVRRAHDLKLTRGGTALFSHAWTAVHVMDDESPLRGETQESLSASQAELLVTFSGYDEALSQFIHARHVYPASRFRFGVLFAPIATVLPDGQRALDYRRFHEFIRASETTEDEAPVHGARRNAC